MEDAIKALEMAAGVLLAVIIMTLIAYFFSSIKNLPQQQDQSTQAEQLAKFNLEYEVYNKKAMYGVDVISCLNKAQSNNEKYAEGGRFLAGKKYGDLYSINVHVTLKNGALKEYMEVSAYIKETQEMKPIYSSTPIDGVEMGKIGFSIHDDSYSNFEPDYEIRTIELELTGDANKYLENDIKYDLLARENHSIALSSLLEFSSSNMRQIVNNTTGKDLDVWSTVIWNTALYDFKTRRFKCDGIKYEIDTGRVSNIYFTEIEDTNT